MELQREVVWVEFPPGVRNMDAPPDRERQQARCPMLVRQELEAELP